MDFFGFGKKKEKNERRSPESRRAEDSFLPPELAQLDAMAAAEHEDLARMMAAAHGMGDIENVQLTESDLHDSDLLAELAAAEAALGLAPEPQARHALPRPAQPQPTAAYAAPMASKTPSRNSNRGRKPRPKRPRRRRRRGPTGGGGAAAEEGGDGGQRARDKQTAMSLLRQAKQLEGGGAAAPPAAAAAAAARPTAAQPAAPAPRQAAPPAAAPARSAAAAAPQPLSPAASGAPQQRRASGAAPGPPAAAQTPPRTPEAAGPSLRPPAGSSSSSSPSPSRGRSREELLEAMEAQLQRQIDAAHEAAKECLRRGDREAAAEVVREKNRHAQGLLAVSEARRSPGAGIPPHHYALRTRREEVYHRDLSEADLEIALVSVEGIPLKGKEPCQLRLSYPYPSSDAATEWTGPPFNVPPTGSAQPGVLHKIRIERKRSALARFLEKKRVDFEIQQAPAKILGIFGSSTPLVLGVGELPLKALLTRSDFNERVPLKDEGGRRANGAFAEFRARVRDPIAGGKDQREVTEEVLIVGPRRPPPSRRRGRRAGRGGWPSAGAAGSPAASRPSTGASRPSTGAGGRPSAAAADDDDLEDPESLTLATTNGLLEWELEQARAKEAACGGLVPDELTARIMETEMRMQVLVTEVQSGKLTPEGYEVRVRGALAAFKSLAAKWSAAGDKAKAMAALRRAKVVEKELAETQG
eukprot:tig00020724_g13415.t1